MGKKKDKADKGKSKKKEDKPPPVRWEATLTNPWAKALMAIVETEMAG